MAKIPDAQLTHVGIYVQDLKKMKEFYCAHLGMIVSDEGSMNGRELAFLSRSENEHHQIVMIYDPGHLPGVSSLGQISFRLKDLEALRSYYLLLKSLNISGLEGRNHGNSWSFYFMDPEDNKIEVYVPSHWHVAQPWRAPLDLTKSVSEIEQETQELIQSLKGYQPADEWREQMKERLKEAV